jgi:hypothetical protein
VSNFALSKISDIDFSQVLCHRKLTEAYSLRSVYNHQINTQVAFMVIYSHAWNSEKFESQCTYSHPAWNKVRLCPHVWIFLP